MRKVGLGDLAIAARHSHQRATERSWLVKGIKCPQGSLAGLSTSFDGQGAFGDGPAPRLRLPGPGPDPELAFVGVRALRALAEFCEAYQVRRLREAGHSWARVAAWAGVSPQAVHKKYAQAIKVTKGPST